MRKVESQPSLVKPEQENNNQQSMAENDEANNDNMSIVSEEQEFKHKGQEQIQSNNSECDIELSSTAHPMNQSKSNIDDLVMGGSRAA